MRTDVVALGPALLAEAQTWADDLNEAFYLVHRVVSRVLLDPDMGETPIDLETARGLLQEAAAHRGGRDPPPPL